MFVRSGHPMRGESEPAADEGHSQSSTAALSSYRIFHVSWINTFGFSVELLLYNVRTKRTNRRKMNRRTKRRWGKSMDRSEIFQRSPCGPQTQFTHPIHKPAILFQQPRVCGGEAPSFIISVANKGTLHPGRLPHPGSAGPAWKPNQHLPLPLKTQNTDKSCDYDSRSWAVY